MECYRHPEKEAKRRCYQCHRPICRACQVSLDHHLFCGEDCHTAWVQAQQAKKERREKRPPRPSATALLRQEITGVADKLAELTHRLENMEAKSDELGHQLSAWAERLTAAELKSEALDQELSRGLGELKAERSEIRQEVAALLTAQEKILDSRLSELSARLAAGEETLSQLTEKLAELSQGLTRLAQAPREEKAPSAEVLAKISEAQQRLEKLEATQKELREELRRSEENQAWSKSRELELIRKRLQTLEQETSQGKAQPEKTSMAFTRRGRLMLLVGLLVGLIIGAGLATARVSQKKAPASAQTPATAATAGEAGPAPNVVYDDTVPFLAPPTLDLAPSRIALRDAETTITGYAPGAVKVTLYLNMREWGPVPVFKQGFVFKKVALEPGLNVVQVKAQDNAGNSAFSLAHLIDRISVTEARVRAVKGQNRMRGDQDKPYLALTIDAGSTNWRAEQILAVLRERHLTTTFFVTGQFIERYPEIVKQIVADGHEVGNHTYSHPHCTTFTQNRKHNTNISKKMFQEELLKTKKLFEETTGQTMAPWWRAPYGEHNQEIREWAEEVGFYHIDWTRTPKNFDILDWVADTQNQHYLDANGLYRRLTELDDGVAGKANGGIILIHLGTDRQAEYLDTILGRAIDTLAGRGYQFVSISRMFGD